MRGEEREGAIAKGERTPLAVKLHRRAFHSHRELREQWRRQEIGRRVGEKGRSILALLWGSTGFTWVLKRPFVTMDDPTVKISRLGYVPLQQKEREKYLCVEWRTRIKRVVSGSNESKGLILQGWIIISILCIPKSKE